MSSHGVLMLPHPVCCLLFPPAPCGGGVAGGLNKARCECLYVFNSPPFGPPPPPPPNGILYMSDASGALGKILEHSRRQRKYRRTNSLTAQSLTAMTHVWPLVVLWIINAHLREHLIGSRRSRRRGGRPDGRGKLINWECWQKGFMFTPICQQISVKKACFSTGVFSSIEPRETRVRPERSGCSLFLCLTVDRRGYTVVEVLQACQKPGLVWDCCHHTPLVLMVVFSRLVPFQAIFQQPRFTEVADFFFWYVTRGLSTRVSPHTLLLWS